MAIDTTQAHTRRALLAGVAGGLGAAVAAALGRAMPAAGAANDPLVIGVANEGSSLTRLTSSGGNAALRVEHTGSGGAISAGSVDQAAVSGTSEGWYGVAGTSLNANAVLAQAYTGTSLVAVSHLAGTASGSRRAACASTRSAAWPRSGRAPAPRR